MRKNERIEVDDYLENTAKVLTGMSITGRRLENKFDVEAARLLTSLKAGGERLRSDVVNLTHH
jgi:hypothetical protein